MVVCKSNTLQGKTFKKRLQLDFCFNRSNRALKIKVNQSIARTVSTATEQLKRTSCLFGGIQDWIVYLKTWLRYLERKEKSAYTQGYFSSIFLTFKSISSNQVF